MHIMKKSIFVLTALTLILSVNVSFARNVSVDEAKTAAMRFMNAAGSGMKAELSDINLIHQINNPELKIPACYFFNVSDWGWVIVSASTTMDPIIGYNDNGRNLDIKNAPENMMSWVESFAGIVSAMQVEDANNPIEDNKTWTELLEGTNPSDNSTKASHILFWDEWDQGDNNGTTYNIFCPKHNGVSTVTGCVATALSQIVHYYQFPKVGQNSQRYYWQNDELDMSQPVNISLGFDTMHFDYSIMPNKIVSTTPTASRREVSRLCYAVGVVKGCQIYAAHGYVQYCGHQGSKQLAVGSGVYLGHGEFIQTQLLTAGADLPDEIIGCTVTKPTFKYVADAVAFVLLAELPPGQVKQKPELQKAGLGVLYLTDWYHCAADVCSGTWVICSSGLWTHQSICIHVRSRHAGRFHYRPSVLGWRAFGGIHCGQTRWEAAPADSGGLTDVVLLPLHAVHAPVADQSRSSCTTGCTAGSSGQNPQLFCPICSHRLHRRAFY